MTNLQLSVESSGDSGNSSPVVKDHEGIRPYHLRFGSFPHPLNETSPDDKTAKTSTSDENDEDREDQEISDNDEYDEPLGYQNFLCDVVVEHCPGGNRSNPSGNMYCFKMKRLPYMVVCNRDELGHCNSSTGDDSSDNTNDCDTDTGINMINSYTFDLTSFNRMHIDVSKETCAFLSNSDYVPRSKFKNRQVTLELVSAKLSHSSGHHITSSSSQTSLPTLDEAPPSIQFDSSSRSSNNSHSLIGVHHDTRSQSISHNHLKIAPPPSPLSSSSSSLSSKKFVNYTILIKTVPGLDKHPAVIERRFSDFFDLYQSLMNQKSYADIVEKSVIFPKKVYTGNYSFEKIAERSIEFTKLLRLCISNKSLLWSEPFVSFLFDKEIKEAHRLSQSGDPDDVQALIENAYYIEQKLYSRLSRELSASGTSM